MNCVIIDGKLYEVHRTYTPCELCDLKDMCNKAAAGQAMHEIEGEMMEFNCMNISLKLGFTEKEQWRTYFKLSSLNDKNEITIP